MQIITTTDHLAAFCARAARAPFVTADTEFLRERTYWSKLCLIQLAYPGEGDEAAAVVDPLVEGLSLEPLYGLFRDEAVVKGPAKTKGKGKEVAPAGLTALQANMKKSLDGARFR